MKYKIGDSVKIVADTTGEDYGVGLIGKIVRIEHVGRLPYIVETGYPNGKIWCCDGELELVESAPTAESLLRDMCRVREERASENWQDYLGPNARKAFVIDRDEDES